MQNHVLYIYMLTTYVSQYGLQNELFVASTVALYLLFVSIYECYITIVVVTNLGADNLEFFIFDEPILLVSK